MANNQQVETVHSGLDKAKLAFAVLLVLGGFVAFYILAAQRAAGWMQWLTLLFFLAAGVGVFAVSSWGKEFVGYCRDSVREVKKVVWPKPKEAMQMTIYVFLFVVAVSLFLWCADLLIEWLVYGKLLGGGQ